MVILGINAYHGDSSACIVVDGKLIAAAEEERFRRIKHWAGLPEEAIRYCMAEAQVEVNEIEHIAVNRNPYSNLLNKAVFTLTKRPPIELVKDRLKNAVKLKGISEALKETFETDGKKLKAKIHNVEHHIAHLSSSYFVSAFENSAVVSVDGFGDFVGAMWGVGRNNKIEVKERIFFPHSLGLFYLSITQYLGFPKYGDEYKVMGLSSYGEPSYMEKMRQIVRLEKNGRFSLNLDFFVHHSEGSVMTWDGVEPEIEPVYSAKMENLLGYRRRKDETIKKEHEDIAASLQAMYEEAFFHMLNYVYGKTQIKSLSLAGGCAMNSVANGKIFEKTPFKDIYIQPAAGDAGGAIGAAFYVYNHILKMPRTFALEKPYLGPEFGESDIKREVDARISELNGCSIEIFKDDGELCRRTAREISDGKVVGWFQGRMEWGPRALGNRSIIVDPRRNDMKDILNSRIKRREHFRPFAPSILLESIDEFFETGYPDPFMLKVYKVRPEKRGVIPAVTHVDGSGRLQTVRKEDNPLYWNLINEFKKITGVPVVLNTSFNENEPIVCKPSEALNCFLRTKMDILVLNNYFIQREGAGGN